LKKILKLHFTKGSTSSKVIFYKTDRLFIKYKLKEEGSARWKATYLPGKTHGAWTCKISKKTVIKRHHNELAKKLHECNVFPRSGRSFLNCKLLSVL